MNPDLTTPCFLSCDWGTSAFRLRLIELASWTDSAPALLPNFRVLAETKSDEGVATVHAAWKAGTSLGATKWAHFLVVLQQHIWRLEWERTASLAGVPLVMSGMASSSIGMRELPYQEMPMNIDGSNMRVECVPSDEHFAHDVAMISGVRSARDVMRGEETKLVGALAEAENSTGRQLIIFPGTHSKHVTVEGARATELKTYMTGEFFALLSRHSVLAGSVEGGTAILSEEDRPHFDAGVREGAAEGVLHSAFQVRVRSLLEAPSKTANLQFLSGVLIGAELARLNGSPGQVVIVGGDPLAQAYQRASQVLADTGNTSAAETRAAIAPREELIPFGARSPRLVDADQALIRGQLRVAMDHGILRGMVHRR